MTWARRMRCLPVLLIALFPCVFVSAEPKQLSSNAYIRDSANVLDLASSESIDELNYRLEHWTRAHLDVVTVRSLQGGTSQKSVQSLFDELRTYGVADKDRLLILFVLKDNRFVVVAGTRFQSTLSHRINVYVKQANFLLRQHQSASAIAFLTRCIAEAIASDAEVGLKPVNDSAPLGNWAPVAQPHDVLVRCLGAIVLSWTILIPLILIARRIRAKSLTTRELVTPLGIANLQS